MAGRPKTTPTIQRRRLGNALKQAREQAGKTQDEAGAQISAAGVKVSRVELGESGLKQTDLSVLLRFYGVPDAEAAWIRELARAGRQRGRWPASSEAIPDWFGRYVDLETGASEIRWYQPEVVPGLLQIEPSLRATSLRDLSAIPPHRDTGEEADRQVTVRLERQMILEQPGTTLGFILSESALRRTIGGTSVMREQLRHLATVAERPNVELQVLPFDAQTYQPASFGFTILRFGNDTASDVVYLEDFTDAAYLDRPDAVRAYTTLWNRLQAAAMGQVESRHLILRVADGSSERTRPRNIRP